MTLNTRNKLLLVLDVVASVLFIIFLVGVIFFFVNGRYSAIPSLNRPLNITSNGNIFIRNSPIASIISLLILPLYVSIFGLYIYLKFEKTKSDEIVYLSLFFMGLCLQSFGIMIALLEMWNTSSKILLVIGRCQLCGQVISGIAFLLLAIFVGTESYEERTAETDKRLGIAVCISLLCASIFPINTMKITSALWVCTGFDVSLFLLLVLVSVIAFVVMVFDSFRRGYKFFSGPILSSFLFMGGYNVLTQTDNYLALTIGASCFFSGTFGYLIFLRKKYLWN